MPELLLVSTSPFCSSLLSRIPEELWARHRRRRGARGIAYAHILQEISNGLVARIKAAPPNSSESIGMLGRGSFVLDYRLHGPRHLGRLLHLVATENEPIETLPEHVGDRGELLEAGPPRRGFVLVPADRLRSNCGAARHLALRKTEGFAPRSEPSSKRCAI